MNLPLLGIFGTESPENWAIIIVVRSQPTSRFVDKLWESG